jgi:hypothetical protein
MKRDAVFLMLGMVCLLDLTTRMTAEAAGNRDNPWLSAETGWRMRQYDSQVRIKSGERAAYSLDADGEGGADGRRY